MSHFNFSDDAIAHLAERRGTANQILIWFQARDRETGEPQNIGFWTGDDHQEFLIDDQVRTYFGAGNVIDMPAMVIGSGFDVRQYRITVAPYSPEVRQLLHGFEASSALVEIHSVVFHCDSELQIGDPRRVFKGKVSQAPLNSQPGRDSTQEITLVSSMSQLARGLPLRKTNAELVRVNASERGREYADTTAEWQVPWGI